MHVDFRFVYDESSGSAREEEDEGGDRASSSSSSSGSSSTPMPMHEGERSGYAGGAGATDAAAAAGDRRNCFKAAVFTAPINGRKLDPTNELNFARALSKRWAVIISASRASRGDASALYGVAWQRIIVDEGHSVGGNDRTNANILLNSLTSVLSLSGSPTFISSSSQYN
jgi:hypothetical protein